METIEARLTLRPEVQTFAEAMEAQLRANDHKLGWKGDSAAALVNRLREETAELLDACLGVDVDPGEVLREAADVGNFAMMVADVCGGVSSPPQPERRMSAILGAPEVDARKPLAWFGWLSEYPEEGYMPIDAVDAEDAERQTRALLAGDEPETEITVVRVKADDVAMFQETCERMAQMERTNAELVAALEGLLSAHALMMEHAMPGLALLANGWFAESIDTARAALAKAKEEAQS